MKYKNITIAITIIAAALFAATANTGCGVYGFTDASIPDSIKTIKINLIENRAQYINPQLAPSLTEKLRQKFLSQTKMSLTNNDNADWELNCEIRDYSLSTSAISGQQAANNRVTVGVHIVLNDRKADKVSEYDVSKGFEFKGNQTLQQAESSLKEEMIRTMTDEIFNKLFSEW
ncbi:MAG: LptE family protein [Chitinophagaceae bacterium]|nr:LptE family protein [Chitinophagaceae bacterium]